MASVWQELKRRNVVKVAVAYAIVGWLLIEVSTTVLPVFQAPNWIARVFTFFIVLGFPVAVVIAWAYELTPDGIERTSAVSESASITKSTGKKLESITIVALVLALVITVVSYEIDEPIEAEPENVADALAESLPAQPAEPEREVLPNSIAVLPFDNLSSDPDDAYFAAGVHEEILNRLAKLSALNVIARTSVMQYAEGGKTIPQIAAELNVGTVMEGSVRYADGRVLITAQLIDADTNAHLWSEAYNEEFADIFSIQADVAMNIANALKVQFSLEEQSSIGRAITDSPEAYALFLRANTMLPNPVFASAETLASARVLLDSAIEFDPNFARAYILRSGVYRGASAQERAGKDLEKALQLNPNLGFAHALVGDSHHSFWRDEEARRSFEIAIQSSPNDPEVLIRYALFLAQAKQHEEALQLARRAVELDPKNPLFLEWLAMVNLYAGEYELAYVAAHESVTIDPAYAPGYILLGQMEASRGNQAAAIDSLRKATIHNPGRGNFQVIYGYRLAGLADEVERLMAQFEDPGFPNPRNDFVVAVLLEDHDRAVNAWTRVLLERTLIRRGVRLLRANVMNDPFLNHPELVELRNAVPPPE
jgi:TolB-like protein/Tfp pilus assembly protein PilF